MEVVVVDFYVELSVEDLFPWGIFQMGWDGSDMDLGFGKWWYVRVRYQVISCPHLERTCLYGS